MKKNILVFAFLLSVIACKKTGSNPQPLPQDFAAFLKNTEWAGTIDRTGYQYFRPCSIKFGDDKTVTIHALFIFIRNGVEETPDSLSGTILSIDSLSDGRTRVDVNFNVIDKQSIYITNRKTIIALSANPARPETFRAELFPTNGVSLNGTIWGGRARTSPGANFEYPDVSTINFLAGEGATFYGRGGQSVLYLGIAGAIPGVLLKTIYQQKGARVYMSGFNESSSKLVGYFGVLLPDGERMMVDSRSLFARLPAYVYTNEPYGPNGIAPVIKKQ